MSNTTAHAKRKRSANWEAEFYKNGYPKEVIVIDDTPTPPPQSQPKSVLPYSYSSPSNRALPYPTTTATTRTKRIRTSVREEEDAIAKRRRKENPQPVNQAYPVSYPTNHAPVPAPTPVIEPYDDKDGHYIIRPNESLTPRYKMMRLLGQGTFGKVVECYDRVRRTFCAIKIIRAIPKYRDASKVEIRVLNTLKEHDPLNLNKCIHLLEWFDYRNHICMVFELLGQSVFDFLKANEFRPFPADHIQQFAKQLLTSVAFLHDLKLIHTDLKPENVLLVNQGRGDRYGGDQMSSRVLQSTEIRLIDFGSATFEHDYHSSVVSTRHYRAPEIILGMGWSYPCDIWSIGCILVEFFTGDALFQTHDNLEHLAMMEVVLGSIPPRLKRMAK
ncbi:dual specificity protein kinase kns1 [Apophysomyces ossiformis]|uniref:Dual specificity protein kinase kns1 n=1 Tax=Apophysomyces ossiformis TaxID=679940 RepID=A0A8H7BMR3_9FUNG|nr:dual specificity protein kinase kns1 [Apophysomyces ossiformis]